MQKKKCKLHELTFFIDCEPFCVRNMCLLDSVVLAYTVRVHGFACCCIVLCRMTGEAHVVECHRGELSQVFQEMDLTEIFYKFVEPSLAHV